MKVAVIGAGWYGCHIGLLLKRSGFDVTVFEKDEDIFLGSSGANQFRLHAGFHYARNHRTRTQSADGFEKFKKRYPDLSSPITENLYAIPKYDSIIDFQTYKAIMSSSGLDFTEIEVPGWMKGIDGCIKVHEELILTSAARAYFKKNLGDSLALYSKFTESMIDDYDYVIDCTWGTFDDIKSVPTYFEPVVLLVMESRTNADRAITMVDGDLCSVYPTESRGIYTFSSVIHSPLGSYMTYSTALDRIQNTPGGMLDYKRSMIEDHVSEYIPMARELFRFMSYQLSIKTKPIGASDDRSCYVEVNKDNPKIISVLSGKIDTIFYAADEVLNILTTEERVVH